MKYGHTKIVSMSEVRKMLVGGNFKDNLTIAEVQSWVYAFQERFEPSNGNDPRTERTYINALKSVETFITPQDHTIYFASQEINYYDRDLMLGLGVQNLFERPDPKKSYTGEFPISMFRDALTHDLHIKFPVKEYGLAGHSERRQFGESNALIHDRLMAGVSNGLSSILCIGESLETRNAGKIKLQEFLREQIETGLTGIDDLISLVDIAYEPIWSIGTGVAATPEMAQETHYFIRKTVDMLYGPSVAKTMRLMYGGSVKPENALALALQPDIDGALVGGAALKADDFWEIILAYAKAAHMKNTRALGL